MVTYIPISLVRFKQNERRGNGNCREQQSSWGSVEGSNLQLGGCEEVVKRITWLLKSCSGVAGLAVLLPAAAFASSGTAGSGEHDLHHAVLIGMVFIFAMRFLAACGAIVEKQGLPGVLGELVVGILFGLIMRTIAPTFFTEVMGNVLIYGCAQIGVNLLLFQTGLEEDVHKMKSVGVRAFAVALVGVVLPFAFGIGGCALFFPESSWMTRIFFGATLVATSVGITSKMFKDLGYSGFTKSLVLGAAVIDDVKGLVIFAVVSALVAGAVVTVGFVFGKIAIAIIFLVGAIIIGRLLAPHIGHWLSKIHAGVGMKMSIALLFCGGIGALASWLAGMEPIVGAFAAGLLLDAVHFGKFEKPERAERIHKWVDRLKGNDEIRDEMQHEARHQEHAHVEDLIEGPASLLVPVFFVYTGMTVDITVFSDPKLIAIALAVSALAIIGKLASGAAAGPDANKWVVGWAMVARGEVGLIFAAAGQATGTFSDEVFAVLVMTVVITTLIPPLVLPRLIRKEQEQGQTGAKSAAPTGQVQQA